MTIEGFVTGFNYAILFFAVAIMVGYIVLAAISAVSLRTYIRENRYVRYNALLASEFTPAISLIAPAYNEAMTIEENVRSLMGLNYGNYEVIVVNDGSRDNSLDILIAAYDLHPTDRVYTPHLKTKNVRGIYRSANPAFARLLVVDKENGGKADALNTGMNIASHPYVVCIDVDCVMDRDALLKLAKPFLQETDRRVIATGGVVRIANSCTVKAGKLITVRAPEKLLPRIQVIEYLRAFILGRMAWAKLDGLLLISGAFGMFDREIAMACGGYDHGTVGEDMELVVRMRRYMVDRKLPYTVSYIPDPLCWTEAPDNFTILRKQRSRWTRGTMETLWINRDMFFNPKYRLLGMLSIPYWVFFEYLAPLIEFTGLLITIVFLLMGLLSFKFFLLLLLFVYTYAVLFSVLALFAEEFTYRQYHTFRDLRKLLLVALLEPFYFHPFTIYAALRGNWEKIRGNKGWGDMVRTGFTDPQKKK